MFIEFTTYSEEDTARQVINLEFARRLFPTPLTKQTNNSYWTIAIEYPDTSYHVGVYNSCEDADNEINEILRKMDKGAKVYTIINDWIIPFYFNETTGKWEETDND